jgi:hypothetical protein
MGSGMRAANSGVNRRYVSIFKRGKKPHRARKGVRARAISGLWFASVDDSVYPL